MVLPSKDETISKRDSPHVVRDKIPTALIMLPSLKLFNKFY